MEVPNKSVSFVVIFVLFCFHLGRICDLCFSQKYQKSFYSQDKKYAVWLRRYTRYSTGYKHFFFSFCGESKWESKEYTFCTLGQPIRAQLSCSLAGPTLTYKQQRNWSFIALFLIHAYRVQQGCLLQFTHFDKGQP